MSRGRIALTLAWLCVPGLALGFGFGENEKEDGGQPGGFLAAASSARPLAMGGAHTAVADDASAPFWNASGLAQIQRYDLVTYYSRLGSDANIGSGAFALPTRRFGTFGLNVVGLRSGSFRRRDALNRDLGEFENNASAYLFSQARNFGAAWSGGYTLKAVRQEIAGFSDTGYGLDLGAMMRPHPLWQVGLAVQNAVQPALKLKSSTEKLPMEVRMGGRYAPAPRLTLAADVSVLEDRSPELSLGTEWKVSEPLALRVGANDREISAGVGMTAGDLGVDYAFGFPHASVVRTELGSSHRISFHMRFGTNVMSGSYRDLTRRREEQHEEIVREKRGIDHVAELRSRMRDWNGRMDVETFERVQAARASLRELAFTDPLEMLEAQAYVSHFQGHFDESARLFDRLAEENPNDRRIRRDAEIAVQRAERNAGRSRTAAVYDRMDLADRRRREESARQIARAAETAAVAGGAGGAREPAIEERGEEPPQVAFAPPVAIPPPVRRPPPLRRPAEPPRDIREPAERRGTETPVPAERPPASRPAPEPDARPETPPARPEAPAEPAPETRPATPPSTPAPRQPAAPAAPPPRPELQEARRHFEKGDYVRSHLATRQILEKSPDDRAAARQSMLTGSVVAAQAAILDPQQTVNIPELEARVDKSLALFDRGMTLYRNKNRNDAVLFWERAVDVCPANFLARDMIAQVNEELFDEKWDGILRRANGASPN